MIYQNGMNSTNQKTLLHIAGNRTVQHKVPVT